MDLKQSIGQPRALVSRAALLHNARLVRRAVPSDTRICAVIKADAYGHGATIVADALSNFSCDDSDNPAVDQLAVATIEEAALLPVTVLPVLVLRPIENAFVGRYRAAIELAVRNGWILTLASLAAADDVARIAVNCERRALINLMLDSGAHQGGCEPSKVDELFRRIEARTSLKLVSIGTNLANSSQPTDGYSIDQIRAFRGATDSFWLWAGKLSRHAGASGALFSQPSAHFDMVRPGIAMYGIDPTGAPNMNRALRPAMKWTAPLIGITEIRTGATVGEGQSFATTRDTRIGVVPVGFADGYQRAFSNRGTMLHHGVACPVIGKLDMDYTTIDLTDAHHPRIGDEMTILDSDPISPCSVYALAKWADTTPAEIFTSIGQRIKRVAIDPSDDPATRKFEDANESSD